MLPHARRSFVLAIALPLLAAWATDAPAQWLPEAAAWVTGDAGIAASAAVPSWGSQAPRMEPVRVDGRRVVNTTLGAAGGFAVGAVAGGFAVYNIFSNRRSAAFPQPAHPDGFILADHEFMPAIMAGYGALAGAAVGAPLGAHLANGRRGNPWLGVLGSAAATTAAVMLVVPSGRSYQTFYVVLPVATVGSSAAIELLTTR
jgi:hypothetical protein